MSSANRESHNENRRRGSEPGSARQSAQRGFPRASAPNVVHRLVQRVASADRVVFRLRRVRGGRVQRRPRTGDVARHSTRRIGTSPALPVLQLAPLLVRVLRLPPLSLRPFIVLRLVLAQRLGSSSALANGVPHDVARKDRLQRSGHAFVIQRVRLLVL